MTSASIAETGSPVRSPAQGMERRLLVVAGVFTIAYAAVLVMQSSLTSFYTLDDPYIHLALAENIARGHFGVNPSEASNPSSSILWPWLMAAFKPLGLMLWAPLLVNIAAFLATLNVIFEYTVRTLAPQGRDPSNALILVGLAVFSYNLFGVVFTGMEHSLHTLVSVLAITRILDKRYDRLALVACVASPLLRFEGVLVLGFCLVAAIVDRKFVFAAVAFALAAAVIGAYEVMLAGLGLPALPSSVLAKSHISAGVVAGGHGELRSVLASLWRNLHALDAPMYGLFAAVLLYAIAVRRGRDRLIAAGMFGMLAVFLTIHARDAWARYDVFLFCIETVACIHLLRDPLQRLLTRRAATWTLAGTLVVMNAALGLFVLVASPLAAGNINAQQHQMHRFVTGCWKGPIAVNDLGWTSFRNDQYVLDLAGLGNETARRARLAGGYEWMAAMAASHHVDAAAIYPEWFDGVPESWVHVGDLLLTEPKITPAEARVAFYATRPAAAGRVRTCLDWLASDLPAGARIDLTAP
ncbi:MAG: hypothetical protein GC155_11270 [Alphaproteobacteria bacterium]|nr:hypothetical protein [Alphaproteobacteria bacterium]